MAIPFVKTGQAIRTSPLNDVVRAVNLLQFGSGPAFPGIGQAGIPALALNKTGADMKMGHCASIIYDNATSYRDDPTQLQGVGTVLRLRAPTADDLGNFVIAAESIADDQSGYVYVSGVVLARVADLEGSGPDELADIDDTGGDTDVLKFGASGAARVMDIITETNDAGISWCMIKFPLGGALEGTADTPFLVGRDPDDDPDYDILHPEAIEETEWDRTEDEYQDQGSGSVLTDGLKLTIQTRTEYFDTGDEKLYGYFRDFVFDSAGLLLTVGPEIRYEIEAPVVCS